MTRPLPAGSLGGRAFQYVGTVDVMPRVELHLEWRIHSKHLILPKRGTDFSSPDAFAAIGMTITGMPALNAIPAVVDAPPGIVTSADVPLRAFAGRFAQ